MTAFSHGRLNCIEEIPVASNDLPEQGTPEARNLLRAQNVVCLHQNLFGGPPQSSAERRKGPLEGCCFMFTKVPMKGR